MNPPSIFNMTHGALGTHPQLQYWGLGNCEVPWLKNEFQLMRKGVSTQQWKGWTQDKPNRQPKKKKKVLFSLKNEARENQGKWVWLHPLPREKTAKQLNFECLSLLTRRHFQRKNKLLRKVTGLWANPEKKKSGEDLITVYSREERFQSPVCTRVD